MNTQNAKGRLRESFVDLDENGQVGDWAFAEDDTIIFVRLPDGSERGDMGPLRLSPYPIPDVPDWQWDGNRNAPTLTPSINYPGVWHGWMRKGELVSC